MSNVVTMYRGLGRVALHDLETCDLCKHPIPIGAKYDLWIGTVDGRFHRVAQCWACMDEAFGMVGIPDFVTHQDICESLRPVGSERTS